MKYLIINADDVGVARNVDDAVIELFNTSSITACSIMSVGTSFKEACKALKGRGVCDVGVHFALTGRFRPVSSWEGLSSGLWGGEGFFSSSYMSLARKIWLGKINMSAVKQEMIAQVERVRGEGFDITHFDAHEHVHMLPPVLDAALETCAEFSIPYVRVPFEDPFVAAKSFRVKDLLRHKTLRFFAGMARRKVKTFGLSSNSGFLGHFHSGRLTRELFFFMADNMPQGVTELAVHPTVRSSNLPAWYINGPSEKRILMSEEWKSRLKDLGISCITHRDIIDMRQ